MTTCRVKNRGLWPIDDEASARLTSEAVAAQSRPAGRSVSAAEHMRLSMVKLAGDASRDSDGKSFAHPRVWAPFILVSGE